MLADPLKIRMEPAKVAHRRAIRMLSRAVREFLAQDGVMMYEIRVHPEMRGDLHREFSRFIERLRYQRGAGARYISAATEDGFYMLIQRPEVDMEDAWNRRNPLQGSVREVQMQSEEAITELMTARVRRDLHALQKVSTDEEFEAFKARMPNVFYSRSVR